MEQSNKEINYALLKKNFLSPPNEYRTVPFLHLDGDISDGDNITTLFAAYKKCGYGGLALLPVTETKPAFGSEEYLNAYGGLLERAKKAGLQIIYYDDLNFPSGCAGTELRDKYPGSLARQLRLREYACTSGERTHFKLDMSGTTMSVVAIEEETRDILDLRDYITEENGIGYVVFDTPEGNWTIQQYYCVIPEDEKFVNYLSYDDSRVFVNLTYKRFADRFEEYIGSVINMTFYDDLQYRTVNRRMWDENFNRVFEEKYGFDPTVYYPALFGEIAKDTGHYRSLMMTCRAEMLADGFFRAVSDFAKTHGLINTGHVAEPKATASSWMCGDGMLYQKYAGAPGLDLVHRYMYGFNGIKIASSSAYNYDRELVCCEIYGNYIKLTPDLIYREALNALSRGVNFLIPHTLWLSGVARIPHEVSHRNPEFRDMIREFNDFAARCQSLLRGGKHVCDIALLYPIYSVASQTTLFDSPVEGFEFAHVPENADFMNVINAVMNYCGHDLTVIHPQVFNERCHTDGGQLYLANEVNSEQYKLLILPGASQISIYSLRLAAKFFDDGGVIVATDELPYKAFEFNPEKKEDGANIYDVEAASLIEHIFGVSAGEITEFESYLSNKNDNGGQAYFIPAAKTAADGTDLIEAATLELILEKTGIAWDICFDEMPRVTNTGILNLIITAYYNVNISAGSGGVFNHIHRRIGGCDIWFCVNSTKNDYDGAARLRGHFASVEEWNPHTGKIRKLTAEYTTEYGTEYTRVPLTLDSAKGVFLVARTEAPKSIFE